MTAFIAASELMALADLRCFVVVSEAKKVIGRAGEAAETARGKRAA
jgi:hypothetical protein